MTKIFISHRVCWSFLILLSFLLPFHAQAQRYDFAASSGTFTPLVGGTAVTSIQVDDALSSTITLPGSIAFNYFGTSYTQFQVSSNGYITFDLTSVDVHQNNISDNFLSKSIAPLWDDMDGTGGTASYQVSGTAPNQVFTFEWLNWKWNYQASSAGISFQVKLYETTNKIEFIYRQEAGSLNLPSASIGLIGDNTSTSDHFYSLSNSTASPTLDPVGVNTISAKPANGQVYSFTPNPASFTAPTQAINITTPSLASTTTGLSWTNGNGAFRAVFMKQTAVTGTVTLIDGAFYQPNSSFGQGTQAGASGWFCVYNGSGNTTNVTDLQSGLPYLIQVVEYNGLAGAQKYAATTSTTNNPVNPTTVLAAPTAPISTITIKHRSSSQVTFNLTEGNGTKRAIFMRAASSGTSAPVDNTTYTANLVFGSGTQILTSGWFCVFNGASATDLNVTGLISNTDYLIHVVDYNGTAGSEKYFSSSATDNPGQFTTFITATIPTYSFAATAGTFTPITGGTAVNEIERDDFLSASLPIGFSFYHGGIPFTQFKASSNGFLTFNLFETNANVVNDLTNSLARPLVAPLWDDLSGSSGQASYIMTGSTPNRIFTFEWLNWQWNFGATAGISFQVKLYEADNKVEYIYRQEAGALSTPTASIGMAFPSTGSGNFLSLNNSSASPTTSSTAETSTIAAKPADGQVYSFTPAKLSQTITFGALTAKNFGDPTFNLTATASSSLTVSYASSNTAVATVSGNTVTIVGGGTTTITASQAGDIFYAAATPVPQALTVNKIGQTITFGALAAKNFGNAAFDLTATASSSLPVSYASSNTAVATVSGNTVTIVGIGSTDITASQSGSVSYNAATPVMQPLTVNKGDQTITFAPLPTKLVGDAAFSLTATSSSNLAVTYSSSNTAVATISGSTVTLVGAGTTTITAEQIGNANYNAAASVPQVLTVKQTQTITFGALAAKTFGDATFNLTATASSSLAVSYTSSVLTVATISGNQVTIVGSGSTIITASQPGNSDYGAAVSVEQALVVNMLSQTITFQAISAKTIGDAPFSLTASASSTLPVSFTTASDKVSITGSQVSLLKAGSVTIKADQSGNSNYANAPTIEQIFCINPAKPTISVTGLDTEGPILTSSATTGNQWSKDGSPVSGATNNTFTVSTPGVYTVVSKVDNCSSQVSDGEIIVITGDINTTSDISIYPNPVEHELIVALAPTQSATISITDMLGRTMWKTNGMGTIRFDVKNFSPGSYIVSVQTNKALLSKKINKK